MSYVKVTWRAGETALGPTNMNRMEDGIDQALTDAATASGKATTLEGTVGNLSTRLGSAEGKITALETKDAAEKDYITEIGTSNGWTYRKWNSGLAECWGEQTTTSKLQYHDSQAGGYKLGTESEAAPVSMQDFPFDFTAPPMVHVNVDTGAIVAILISGGTRESVSNAGSWTLFRNTTNNGAQNKRFMFYCVGTWK